MTEFGEKFIEVRQRQQLTEVVFYDFDNILSFEELFIKTQNRFNELIQQGFTKQESINIIFECKTFKRCFLNRKYYIELKRKINGFVYC